MPSPRPSARALAAWRELLTYARWATGELDAELRREQGIGLDEYDVLLQLSEGPRTGTRMSDLSSSLLVAPSSCTRLVGRLVERGWAQRRGGADGRVVVVTLTPAGRAALRRAAVVHLRGIERVFGSRLDDPSLAALAAAFTRLRAF